jgi:hypothetical protein
LARLIRESVERTQLDLGGLNVLTEAASGPYVVTPVIAALAGADVVAVTADSRYGTIDSITRSTMELADHLGVASRVTVTGERTPDLYSAADVVTNSGHVRPITGDFARALRPGTVVPLMFETWEIDAGRIDIDLDQVRARGVIVAGTNERHPDIDVFSFLGLMAVLQLADAGISAYRGRIALLCENPFHDYIVAGLKNAGAEVSSTSDVRELLAMPEPDAVVLAATPGAGPTLTAADIRDVAARWPDVTLCQFWGDLNRSRCAAENVAVWPREDPGIGHMGVLPSRVGPEPIVRLQTGGLKVAQVLRMPLSERTRQDEEWLDV